MISTQKEHAPFRAQIETQLGSKLTEDEFANVIKEQFPEAYYRGGLRIADVVDRIRFARKLQSVPETQPKIVMASAPKPRGEKNVPERIAAISDVIAEMASSEPAVKDFRRTVMKDEFVRWEDVETWIKARATEDGPPTLWVTLPIPKGHELRGFASGGYPITPALSMAELPLKSEFSGKLLDYGVPDNRYVRKVPTAATGTLGRLRELSERLAQEYTWIPAQATIFVLTNISPLLQAITVRTQPKWPIGALSRLHMSIDPALGPRDVAIAYRKARTEFLGRRHRNLSEKHLRLAVFTIEHPGQSLKDRMKLWNRKYPKWKYKEESNFGRDSQTAQRRLLSNRTERI